MDKQAAGLLADLKSRGLFDETLVVWGGEFGRTPMSEGPDGRETTPASRTSRGRSFMACSMLIVGT